MLQHVISELLWWLKGMNTWDAPPWGQLLLGMTQNFCSLTSSLTSLFRIMAIGILLDEESNKRITLLHSNNSYSLSPSFLLNLQLPKISSHKFLVMIFHINIGSVWCGDHVLKLRVSASVLQASGPPDLNRTPLPGLSIRESDWLFDSQLLQSTCQYVLEQDT